MLKVYLAGPEVFHPDASSIGARKLAICREFGFEGLFPLDAEAPSDDAAAARLDTRIYQALRAMMRVADFGVFNLTPFRGVSADAGTVFELGAFVGMGKPVFGYSDDPRHILARVSAAGPVGHDPSGIVDADGMKVEDLGNGDNLMITCALAAGGTPLITGEDPVPWSTPTLDTFRRCVAAAARSMG